MTTTPAVNRRPSPLTSVRVRFALAYAGLLAGTGLALVVLFYTYLRFVPGYSTRPSGPAGTESGDPAPLGPIDAEPTLLSNTILILLALAIVVIAMWIGWLIAGRLLRPLAAINDAAIRVGQGDLDHRVRLAGPEDEFANLARAFDSMLDRIQASLDAHQRFAANASHELQTPLSTNKTMLDVALSDPAGTDFVELARRLRRTNQDSIETVDALLDLADIGQGELDVTEVDLSGLAEAAATDSRTDATAQSITVSTELSPAIVRGNATLLSRLVANLVQNAVRHNVIGGSVEVRTHGDSERAWIEVENTGGSVSAEAAATLTEPFVRAGGRAANTGHAGRGLGLAIVQSIVLAHGGTLAIVPRDAGGLLVTVSVPR